MIAAFTLRADASFLDDPIADHNTRSIVLMNGFPLYSFVQQTLEECLVSAMQVATKIKFSVPVEPDTALQ